MFPFRIPSASAILLLASLMQSSYALDPVDPGALVLQMEAAYAEVTDYQANLEIKTYGEDGSFETKKVLYTFKKPEWIRLDFQFPYAGMILIYPDPDGKALLHYFFTLHLRPDHPLLRITSGQRIDQTDMGLLIRNISRSLTDRRRGAWTVTEEGGDVRIQVAADDHFQEGVVTRYEFLIDKKLRLPVQVRESTPGGLLKRAVFFRNLRTNIGIPDQFFQWNGG